MTMDYRNPYSVYPEYYCPPYQGAGYQYPQQQQHYQPQQQQQQQQQHYLDQSAVSGQQKNYNSSAAGPAPHPQQQYLPPQHQQRPPHYHPAFHQHNQQQQQHSHYSSPYLPNFLVSSGTGLTPSLTPTTIATIEQSFLELQSAQQNRVYESVVQSGFVPPVIDAGHSTEVSQDSQEYSSEYSDGEWEPTVKRGRMSQAMKDINNVDLIMTAAGTTNAAPQRKYTRRNKDEKLPPEEEEKRRVRRERNKLAAAKCRQRRVDHTNILVAETEKLEAEQSQLESEIQNLQYVKDQLEFVLQAHQPLCKVEKSTSHSDKLKTDIVFNRIKPDPVFSSLKSEKDQIEFFLQCRSPADKVKHEPGSCAAGCDSCSSHDTSSLVPENLSLSTSAGSTLPSSKAASSSVSATLNSSSIMETSAFNSRPTSLPLVKRERASMLSSATGITIDTPSSGVSITPSSLFYPGLESMVDGSTGLTPLTGMSCSSQVQQNTSEGRSESESNLISL